MADLVPRGYMVLFLTPGSHLFRPQWDPAVELRGPAARIGVAAGDELFMKLQSSSSASGHTQSFSARWSEVPRAAAIQELREYGLVAVVSP
jgi:hypothetical protein